MELTSLLIADGWADRRAAMLRAALFCLVALTSMLILSQVLKQVARVTFADLTVASLPLQIGAKLGFLTGLVLLPTAAMLFLFREPLANFGWSTSGMSRAISLGAGMGVSAFLATITLIALLSRTTISMSAAPTSTLLIHFVLSLLVWTVGALLEEALYRGYLLVQLSRAWSFWPAALLSSCVFAVVHLDRTANPIVSFVTIALLGLIFCYSVRVFGSIWFAIAFHASWNFFQSFVFGVNNSGSPPPAFLSSWAFQGPAWITGGQVGPEGSLVAIVVVAVTLLVFALAVSPWMTLHDG